MNPRGRWQGMLTIARLNWPMYLAAVLVLIASIVVVIVAPARAIRLAGILSIIGCVWLLLGSLVVSHLVYDRSDLYGWNWLGRALAGCTAERFIFCHAGLDEASVQLRKFLGAKCWLTLDHYDRARMTEPSIHRARRLFTPAADTQAAPVDHWPAETASVDIVFGLLAIHEFRSDSERAAWFAEARRCLAENGRVVLAEHTRDAANFLAFGPGFLHFHSPATWQRCWKRAGLSLHDEFRVTPWVRIFVLTAA